MKYQKLAIIIEKRVTGICFNFFWKIQNYHYCNILPIYLSHLSIFELSFLWIFKNQSGLCLVFRHTSGLFLSSSKYIVKE